MPCYLPAEGYLSLQDKALNKSQCLCIFIACCFCSPVLQPSPELI